MNDDRKRLVQLLQSGHPCVSILTYEEAQALSLVHAAAGELNRAVMQWSVISGIRDASTAGGAIVSDTEHPAAALFFLSTMSRSNAIVVMLDLIPSKHRANPIARCRKGEVGLFHFHEFGT